jgi:Kef-type K+ transport system membrane component KefB
MTEFMQAALGVAMLFGAVAIITTAFAAMKWNPNLGLIAAGVAFGPGGLKIVAPTDTIVYVMSEVGIMFLLLLIGVELSADRLKSMAKYVFGLGPAHFIFSGVLAGVLAKVLGVSLYGSIAIGIAFAMSSTAFVLQMLKDSGQLKGQNGQMSLSVLLFQDLMVPLVLLVIPMLVMLAGVKNAGEGHGHGGGDIKLIPATITMTVIFVVSKLVVHNLISMIHAEHRNKFFLPAIIASTMAMGVTSMYFGFSPSLGAFLAGLSMAGAAWNHDVKSVMKPLESTFLGIFFISVGAQVPVLLPALDMAKIVGVAMLLIALKIGAGYIAAQTIKISKRNSLRLGLTLAQAGEFSFIVITAATPLLPNANFWTGVAVLSLVCTPMLVSMAGNLRNPKEDTVLDISDEITDGAIHMTVQDEKTIAG